MIQWEYLTMFLEAKVHKGDDEMLSKRFNKKKLPKSAPERMIPELDQLGESGWELIHMEPVAEVGGNGDVLFHGAPRWSSNYFCVFKRPKPQPVPQTAPIVRQHRMPEPPPTTPPSQEPPPPTPLQPEQVDKS
jgi:hypothetical protein